MSTDIGTDITTDPSRLFGLAEGVYAVDVVVTAACHLDLFNWLDEHPATVAEICVALDVTERPTGVVLTLLAAMDLVEQDAAGVHRLTELARRYLLRSSAWDLTPLFKVLKDRPSGQELLTVLRTGQPLAAMFGGPGGDGPPGDGPPWGDGPPPWGDGPPPWGDGPPPFGDGPPGGGPPGEAVDWAAGMADMDFAADFLAMTDSRNAYLADVLAERLDLSGAEHVLDVAGGSGIYASALVRRNPGLRATVLEQPPVDEVARQSIAGRGLQDRVGVRAGDILRGELPTDADVHLLSNVVHDWGAEEVLELLRASYRALPAGGRIAIHDALLDEGNALAVAEYSVLLMVYTAGRCYAATEIEDLLARAGFVRATRVPTAANRSVVVAHKPA